MEKFGKPILERLTGLLFKRIGFRGLAVHPVDFDLMPKIFQLGKQFHSFYFCAERDAVNIVQITKVDDFQG